MKLTSQTIKAVAAGIGPCDLRRSCRVRVAPIRTQSPAAPITPPVMTSPPGAAAVEQRTQGARPGATLVASFDGLGVGFEGPQGHSRIAQSVRQQPRRRARPHYADRQYADGHLHEEGQAISTPRAKCFTVPFRQTRSSKASAARARLPTTATPSFAMTNSPIAG